MNGIEQKRNGLELKARMWERKVATHKRSINELRHQIAQIEGWLAEDTAKLNEIYNELWSLQEHEYMDRQDAEAMACAMGYDGDHIW